MKFVQKDLGDAAEASSGGGERGLAREILTLGGALVALVGVGYFGVGFLVEWSLPWVSVEREQRWFADFPVEGMAVVLTDDRHIQWERAQVVLVELQKSNEVPAIEFKVVLLPDAEPNAFALPGGTIAVTYGLMDVVGADEIALGFVLGHELGHFIQRDHLRGLGRSIGRGVVWTLVFGGNGGIDLLSDRATRLLDLGYSRDQEVGADRWGARLVMAAYGSLDGGDRLFRWLAMNEEAGAGLTLLSSHPAPADRVTMLREEAANYAAEAGIN